MKRSKDDEFIIDTENPDETISELKKHMRHHINYSLWPDVSYAHQKLIDRIIEEVPDEKRGLSLIRDGIAPSEFEDMNEHNYQNKSTEEKVRERERQIIDKEILLEIFKEVDWKEETILRTLYETGCRRGEIIAIQERDLNFDSSEAPLVIELQRRAYQSNDDGFVVDDTLKVRDNRLVRVGERCRDLIKRKIEDENLERNQYLFYNDVKRSTAYSKIDNTIEEAFDGHSKPEDLSPHNFRHTRATEIVDKLGLYEAKEYLGHRSVEKTEVYIHVEPESGVIGKITNALEDEEESDNVKEEESAESILRKKLAKEEIDIEEFKERMEALKNYE
jgi:integrase